MKARPAVRWLEAIDSIGPEKVWAADFGPIAVTISVIVAVVAWIADQAEDRDQRDQRREEREQPVVGESGGPVGEVVVPELGRGPLQSGKDSRQEASLPQARPAKTSEPFPAPLRG